MKRAGWLLLACGALLALIALGALVAAFVLAYVACFRPGVDDDLATAALLSVILTGVAGVGAFLAAIGASDLLEVTR